MIVRVDIIEKLIRLITDNDSSKEGYMKQRFTMAVSRLYEKSFTVCRKLSNRFMQTLSQFS